ncbi:MAG: Zn-dependent hydrolase [Bacteroidales bacterium]|nr:Zn-dependent hydrolase [Bacteroidales bacterium]MCF8327320.1 Zn-dependent hydrolase [Bacteroidales bacterium]
MFKKVIFISMALLFAGLSSCNMQGNKEKKEEKSAEKAEKERLGLVPEEGDFHLKEDVDIDQRLAKYEEVELTADISHLTDNEKKVLSLMFDAAKIMEELFWRQALGDKESFMNRLQNDKAKEFAKINYGPWDRLENNESFIKEFGKKPEGANFYPADMTKQEFEALDNEDKSSLYTLIRRDENDSLKVVWYHEAYKSKLEEASKILKNAAKVADNKGLKKYLNLRAKALVTSDYLESDMAWMDMKDASLDLVYGPIENYEDGLFGYKAAFEAFVLVKDKDWSQKLTRFAEYLPEMQKNLPVDEKYKQDEIGSDADLNAYEVVYYAGDCNAGSKTIAINLPNDERVQQEKGSRKLQLKNAMKAKFDKILMPITQELIVEEQRKYITFDAFFQNTMFHEVAHGMGVKNTVNDKGTVRKALKEQYSAIEEGKADIMGLYLVQQFHNKGELEGDLKANYMTFVASIFRSIRFGTASAHGKANMVRFNYLIDQGALVRTENGQYRINFEKLEKAMVDLLNTIIVIQGDGDYDRAKNMIEEMGMVKDKLAKDLKSLEKANIPVDIVYDQGKSNLGLNQ